jgi:hypothetical protein
MKSKIFRDIRSNLNVMEKKTKRFRRIRVIHALLFAYFKENTKRKSYNFYKLSSIVFFKLKIF